MVSTITRTAKPLPQHASTRTCTSSQPYVRTRTRTYHAGLHVAHGVEVEPLGAVDETLQDAVAGASAVEQTHSRQVALEMLRHPALSTCSDVSERRGVEGCGGVNCQHSITAELSLIDSTRVT